MDWAWEPPNYSLNAGNLALEFSKGGTKDCART